MRHLCLMMLSVVLVWVRVGAGQTSQPVVPTSSPAEAKGTNAAAGSTGPGIPKGTLGLEYVDGSFGFSIRPLAGATVDRRKRTVEGKVQLVQFVRLEVAWSMSVRLWTTNRPVDVIAAKDALRADLLPTYPDLAIAAAEPVRVASRDAVRLAATFSNEGQVWSRCQAVIPLRNHDHIEVVLTTPGDDKEVAGSAFGQILDSFNIVRTRVQQEQLDAALQRGAALLNAVAAPDRKIGSKALSQPLYLRAMREGKAIGFVEIQEQTATLEHLAGLRILQRAWLFNPDESVQYLEEDKFLANEMTYDEWRNVAQFMPPRSTDPQQRLVVSIEGGVRRNDQLVVEYAERVGLMKKQSKAVVVEPSYAAAAWPLLLPRLADLNKPEMYAFSMYDSERRGLILRVFRVVGPTQILVAGRRVSAFKIEDSEGLVPPIGEMDVDEHGKLLRLASGPVEMTLSTQAEMEREFGERIKAAQARFRENAGPPPTGAATGAPPAGAPVQPGNTAQPAPNRRPSSSGLPSRQRSGRSRSQRD